MRCPAAVRTGAPMCPHIGMRRPTAVRAGHRCVAVVHRPTLRGSMLPQIARLGPCTHEAETACALRHGHGQQASAARLGQQRRHVVGHMRCPAAVRTGAPMCPHTDMRCPAAVRTGAPMSVAATTAAVVAAAVAVVVAVQVETPPAWPGRLRVVVSVSTCPTTTCPACLRRPLQAGNLILPQEEATPRGEAEERPAVPMHGTGKGSERQLQRGKGGGEWGKGGNGNRQRRRRRAGC